MFATIQTRGARAEIETILLAHRLCYQQYPTPQAMNLAEIDAAIEGFALSAKRAEDAGFHGVEIHAANGYLLDQFLTDYTNQREDAYGGSIENRVRLTCEVIAAVKSVTASGFIVGVRLSQGKVNDFDYLWPGGVNDAKIIFREIARVRPSYIHFASEGKGFEHGCFTRDGQSIARIGRELTGIPMIANGGMHSPQLAEQTLSEGHADLVSLGTGALANPSWPVLIKNELPLQAFSPSLFNDGVRIDKGPIPSVT